MSQTCSKCNVHAMLLFTMMHHQENQACVAAQTLLSICSMQSWSGMTMSTCWAGHHGFAPALHAPNFMVAQHKTTHTQQLIAIDIQRNYHCHVSSFAQRCCMLQLIASSTSSKIAMLHRLTALYDCQVSHKLAVTAIYLQCSCASRRPTKITKFVKLERSLIAHVLSWTTKNAITSLHIF